jgi:hypothetical protein
MTSRHYGVLVGGHVSGGVRKPIFSRTQEVLLGACSVEYVIPPALDRSYMYISWSVRTRIE